MKCCNREMFEGKLDGLPIFTCELCGTQRIERRVFPDMRQFWAENCNGKRDCVFPDKCIHWKDTGCDLPNHPRNASRK